MGPVLLTIRNGIELARAAQDENAVHPLLQMEPNQPSKCRFVHGLSGCDRGCYWRHDAPDVLDAERAQYVTLCYQPVLKHL